MGVRRNAAVYAGLVGALALVAPSPAAALSMSEVAGALDGLFATPAAAFAAGSAAGAASAAALIGVAALVARRRRSRSAAVADGSDLDDTAHGSPAAEADAAPSYRPRHMRPDAALFEDDAEDASAPAPSHVARDYEDIAENYVGRATFRERMARRAEGVAATLRDRLGANMMDGVPVIARADGSVGDVGTSWWKNAVGEQSIISDSGFAADEPAIAIPSDFSRSDAALLDARPARSTGISLRVANIDEGAYPERRTVDDLNVTDDWDLALRSLDERIAVEAAALAPMPFADMVGGADTLDEPDNLEPQTAFIPFKTPAGHPEVVDTETYVDYLIEDEFSKSSSPVARRSSSRFLRVLEGGTQPSRSLSDTGAVTREQGGKHFAAPMAAQA